MPTNNFLRQLATLLGHEVEFIIVGGVAAVLEGAPVLTLDLDILYRQTPQNTTRLLGALEEMRAHYRDPAGRHVVPDATKLATFRINLFETDLGDLDVLGRIGQDQTYSDLLDRTNRFEVGGLSVRVLDLEAVIETKRHANRDKDHAMMPVLLRTLDMKRATGGDGE